jgi:hypothetical protein
VTTVATTVHIKITTLPIPGVTTTIPAQDVDFLSPSAIVTAAYTAALFLISILAGIVCFHWGQTDRRRGSRAEPVSRNEREGRPLLGNDSVSDRFYREEGFPSAAAVRSRTIFPCGTVLSGPVGERFGGITIGSRVPTPKAPQNYEW